MRYWLPWVAILATAVLVGALFLRFSRALPESSPKARLLPAGTERRFAVLFGNNTGSSENRPLNFAEADAEKMATVLTELADVRRDDVFLRQGGSAAELRGVLGEVGRAGRALRAHSTDSRIVLFFFFSGHSDGVTLQLGEDRVSFAELRRALIDTGADARISIVDACKSGSILGVKGGHQGGAFDTRLLDDVAITGEAFLTASTGDELALESKEIGGSFFSHHLISALRGAGDGDGNGRITLTEAYRYAAQRTREATSATVYGPQSPSFDYRLIGQGELYITDIRRPRPSIEVVSGFDRVVVTRPPGDQMMAEVSLGGARRLALPPGEYSIRAWRDGKEFTAKVSLVVNDIKLLNEADLVPVPVPRAEKPIAVAPGPPEPFRLGQVLPAAPSRASPYFCEGLKGGWKGCRGSGCAVCSELLVNYPLYLRNHPNCLPALLCEGRYFECSANCPSPTPHDWCEAEDGGWRGCYFPCGVCADSIAQYPKYFANHPNCIPMPGRCEGGNYRPCSVNCPAPAEGDR